MEELQTIRDLVRWAVSCFRKSNIWYGHGTEDAFDEAIRLVLPTLHLPQDFPESFYGSKVTQAEREQVLKNIELRTNERMPVAYITQTARFADWEFYVDQRTLIPRSPIAELIRNQFSGLLTQEPVRILDLCTGSGCIAIATALTFPRSQVDATDISEPALQVAEINIENFNLEDRVFPIKSDLFEAIPHEKYDLILTNPPYEDEETMAEQPKEYHHEPRIGFIAKERGLNIVRRILAEAPNHLTEDGILICEVGQQALALQEAYPKLPFHWVELHNGGVGVFAIDRAALKRHQAELIEALKTPIE